MQWLFSELSVGLHRFSSGGNRRNNPKSVRGGLIAANYVVKNDP
jgi:tricorn protease